MNLSDLRYDYTKHTLSRKDLSLNPYDQFLMWLTQARELKGLIEPTAMQLATSTLTGIPSLRTVLLKEVKREGFLFFSHYTSRKGIELQQNPHATLLFLWKEMERQVIIEGLVEKVSREESKKYFHSRPRKSQLAAYCSAQDIPIESKEVLEKKLEIFEQEFEGKEIPLPETWGGYLLKPSRFEFWQGRESRLHDRFEYLQDQISLDWSITRLSP